MKLFLKILLGINLVLLGLCTVYYLQSEAINPEHAFNTFAYIPSYIAFGVTLIILATLAFIRGISRATRIEVTSDSGRYQNMAVCIGVGFIPLMLMFFGLGADDRTPLVVIGTAGVVLSLLGVIYNLVRSPHTVPKTAAGKKSK